MNFWLQVLVLFGSLLVGLGIIFLIMLQRHEWNIRAAAEDTIDGDLVVDKKRQKAEILKFSTDAERAGSKAKPTQRMKKKTKI